MGVNFDLSSIGFPWALLIAVAVFLALKRKKPWEILDNTLKAVVGYYLVTIGASITPHSTRALSELMQAAFGVRGGVLNTETFNAVLMIDCGGCALAVLILAFAVNLLLARFTRYKGVFLTAHHYLYVALITTALLRIETPLGVASVILLGSLIAGVFGWLCVNVAYASTRRVTGSEGVSMAHSNVGALLLGALAGKLFRGGKEEIPARGEQARTHMRSIPLLACATAFAAYAITACFAGREAVEVCLGTPVLAGIARPALLYGAQVALLLYGFRMLLATVIEMFWDLAQKFVPGVWKGVDASVLIGSQPAAWNRGFLMSCLGGIFAMVMLVTIRAPYVPIMSPTSAYFTGGIAGVSGYAYGGRRGSAAAGVIVGFVSVLLIAFSASRMGVGMDMGVMYGEGQYGLFGMLVKAIGFVINRLGQGV